MPPAEHCGRTKWMSCYYEESPQSGSWCRVGTELVNSTRAIKCSLCVRWHFSSGEAAGTKHTASCSIKRSNVLSREGDADNRQ